MFRRHRFEASSEVLKLLVYPGQTMCNCRLGCRQTCLQFFAGKTSNKDICSCRAKTTVQNSPDSLGDQVFSFPSQLKRELFCTKFSNAFLLWTSYDSLLEPLQFQSWQHVESVYVCRRIVTYMRLYEFGSKQDAKFLQINFVNCWLAFPFPCLHFAPQILPVQVFGLTQRDTASSLPFKPMPGVDVGQQTQKENGEIELVGIGQKHQTNDLGDSRFRGFEKCSVDQSLLILTPSSAHLASGALPMLTTDQLRIHFLPLSNIEIRCSLVE